MGLIAFGGILLVLPGICLLWFFVLYFLRDLVPGAGSRVLLSIPILLFLVALIWWALNGKEFQKQARMDQVDTDCGWKQYKASQPVDGLYIEQIGFAETTPSVRFDLPYSSYEYLNYRGETIHMIQSRRSEMPIPQRTFRYGVRSVQELIKPDIVRTTDTLMNFDNGDIYAKNIAYWFAPDGHSTDVSDVFFLFLKYYPSGCGELRYDAEEKRIIDIFQPK